MSSIILPFRTKYGFLKGVKCHPHVFLLTLCIIHSFLLHLDRFRVSHRVKDVQRIKSHEAQTTGRRAGRNKLHPSVLPPLMLHAHYGENGVTSLVVARPSKKPNKIPLTHTAHLQPYSDRVRFTYMQFASVFIALPIARHL